MFFIAKGECTVSILDVQNRLIKNHKTLTTADYFGEISLIYGCKRTATVISKNYTTLAKLTKQKFKEMTTEFPEISTVLKQGI